MIPYIVLFIFVIIVLIIYKFKSIGTDYDIVLRKIHDGENGIDELLQKKGEVMKKIVENINSINDNAVFPDIDKIIKKKSDNALALDRDLGGYYHELKEYLLVNKSYIPDEVIGEKIKELEEIELDLEATKRFYNDNSNIFNELIDKFPSKIVGRKRGYDFKYLYSFDKEELFEILKNNKTKKNSEI